jgi:dTMP kinase
VPKALFITFEGIEGVGKSTQIRAVQNHFASRGAKVFLTREPGGSPLSDGIRGVLLQSSKGFSIDPMSELLLMEAARKQHVVDVLKKAIVESDLVLCDRFTDSTLAYQGWGRGIDRKTIENLNDLVTEGLKPNLTILLDAPVEKALPRAIGRIKSQGKVSAEDRFEKEAVAFHQRVREGYLSLAKQEPGRFLLIDATDKPEAITATLLKKIEALLKARA